MYPNLFYKEAGIGIMKFKPEKIFSDKLEEFIQNYYNFLYLRDSGHSSSSNLGQLFKEYNDLFDIENIAKSDDVHQADTIRLYNRLITFFIQEYRCSDIRNRLFYETSIKRIKINGRLTTLNNALASIKKTAKRADRFNSGTAYKTMILTLLPELNDLSETLNESATGLGHYNYLGLIEENNNISIADIQKKCSNFLIDTEYMYRDLTKWYLNKYLDLNMDALIYEDILFLYNSFEFHDHFKENRLLLKSTSSLGEMGIYIDDGIHIHTAPGYNRCTYARTYPVVIPGRIHISVDKIRSIEDYISLYGELGTSLFMNSIDREESFTNKRLIDSVSLHTFKSLFSRMVQENKWIDRYLKVKIDRNFNYFLALRQLTFIRDLCIKIKLFSSVYLPNNLNYAINEIDSEYRKNMYLKSNEAIVISDILINHAEPYISFVAMLLASFMEKYLVDKYDEQWWRDSGSGDDILRLWKTGAGLTQSQIALLVNAGHLDSKHLVGKFEEVFQ